MFIELDCSNIIIVVLKYTITFHEIKTTTNNNIFKIVLKSCLVKEVQYSFIL